ncbi:MAG: tetratricopeptide repeat protein [Desulfarculus sp.]|jgi:Flp pilus assembly protein TadD|nr:MAG: tetratricopeptide repeat protein [Desulfarculus sp.]
MSEKIKTTSGVPEDEFLREGLIDRLRQYLAAEPKAWHVRYNLGVALMQDGRPEEALAEFRQVLALSPKHLESMINIAGIHLGAGRPEEAMRVLQSALGVWDIPLVRANLGVAYLQMGRLEDAARELKLAVNSAPNMPDALTNLSSVFLRLGAPDKAEQAAREALKLGDGFAMAHNNLAVVLAEKGQLEQARTHAARAQELGYPVPDGLLQQLGLTR